MIICLKINRKPAGRAVRKILFNHISTFNFSLQLKLPNLGICYIFADSLRIIAYKTLREFYHEHADAEQPLKAWYKEAEHGEWKSPLAIKRRFATSSILSDNRVVFNIKGNEYRMVVKFNYKYGWAWIRFIGTHAEYDKINAEKI